MVFRWRERHGRVYLLHQSGRTQRIVQPLSYAFFVAAGVFAFIQPSEAIRYVVPQWATYVWAAFFVIGGLLCVVGAATSRLAGGVIGLPLLCSASLLYGVSVLVQIGHFHDGAYPIIGLLLIGQAVQLLDRWIGALYLLRMLQGEPGNESG